ncbi:protein ULTRAPETALA 2-like isoform X2 [Tripterygium wilfordii]|uniref:protein ULTRAPETALA 2-like isoform X2 n=1 Tax=Tripterygium wilfordii TaxID=458696 RepID=UPI0018F80C89|nr:protein ULTRAPETALA 2-like isoform X2 [Tripterygium wilfordii]
MCLFSIDNASPMFDDTKLASIDGFNKISSEYIEVNCGCTSKKYGDTMGMLRIFNDGLFVIRCHCIPECKNVTPYEFEKHSRREGGRKWTSHIWVIIDGKKVPIWKTGLLKYYKHATNEANTTDMYGSRGKRVFHRDEFIRCSQCNKERRFCCRTEMDCRDYHDALAVEKWKCSDMPYNKITCEDEEERKSRKVRRGCPRSATCEGCTRCVCFGCFKCRFFDCECRNCIDFMQNSDP